MYNDMFKSVIILLQFKDANYEDTENITLLNYLNGTDCSEKQKKHSACYT